MINNNNQNKTKKNINKNLNKNKKINFYIKNYQNNENIIKSNENQKNDFEINGIQYILNKDIIFIMPHEIFSIKK